MGFYLNKTELLLLLQVSSFLTELIVASFLSLFIL